MYDFPLDFITLTLQEVSSFYNTVRYDFYLDFIRIQINIVNNDKRDYILGHFCFYI